MDFLVVALILLLNVVSSSFAFGMSGIVKKLHGHAESHGGLCCPGEVQEDGGKRLQE